MKRGNSAGSPRHLSVVPEINVADGPLTRGQVADRLGVSVSTVRRYEGSRLHPITDDSDVNRFDPNEVAALAVELAKDPRSTRARSASTAPITAERSRGEVAALVFERFEQRQSLPEIVVGVRVAPEVVRALFDEWCLGLVEGQLKMSREPRAQRLAEIVRESTEGLTRRLSELPQGQVTRVSIARFRGEWEDGQCEFAEVVELGGFLVCGPSTVDEITRRYGFGPIRVTAYGFDPPGLRWEVLLPHPLR